VSVATTPRLVSKVYQRLQDNIVKFRRVINRPLTLSEKILVGHMYELGSINADGLQSGKDYVLLSPDRVAL
jgi:aconitate hydratase